MADTVIALSSGIGLFLLLLIYYLYLAKSFVGKPTDKIYYYLSCCVCTFPPVMYGLQLLNVYITDMTPSLQYFYIEWLVATPLLIIKLSQLANLQLREYLLLLIINEILFISGYIFNISPVAATYFTFLGIAVAAYIGIVTTLIYKYNKLKASYDILTQKTTHFLIVYTVAIWSFYPVIALLRKFGQIAVSSAIIAYVVLDLVAKGIFTLILIGSRELVVRRHSALTFVTRKALRIEPIDYDTEASIATSSVDDFCRRVDIDNERTPASNT